MKFTLPESEAKRLHRDLELQRITTSALFPGIDGIAQETKDWLELWDA